LTPSTSSQTAPAADSQQMTLFQYADHPLLDQLRQLNLDQLSPLEALQLLHEWQQKLEVRD
jgi:DNA mismatch repair protein MutS